MRKAIAGALVVACFSAYADDEPNSGHKMTKKGRGDAAAIARAMSAGPRSISKDATIMKVTADGKMSELRKGTNGWMCMTMSAAPDATPMCADKEWQSWTDAYLNKKDPEVKGIGTAYMLQGDKGASNTDPYADKATAHDWVVSGPHIMLLTSDPAQLDALPTDPWNGGPWVMWKGTKYAHIMVPTAPMPKPAAKPAEKK